MKKRIYILTFILLLIDIIFKLIIKNAMNLYQSIIIIPNFFNITYVNNIGAAFSILEGKQLFLIIIGIIFLIFLIINIRKEEINKLKLIYYSLLISGILGNLIDRIIYGFVIDFLDFKIFNMSFPTFNLADTFICISVILIIIESLIGGKNAGNFRSK